MKILVTGANGYLGSGIVEVILNTGNEVVASDFKVDHIDDRAEKKPCNLLEIENGEMDLFIILMRILMTFLSTSILLN